MPSLSSFFRSEKPKMSSFNLSRRTLTTAGAYTVMPVLVEECVPGDRFKYNLVCGIKTLQTLAPVYGGIDVDFDFYFCALSNYVPAMGQNAYGFDENMLPLPSLIGIPVGYKNSDPLRSRNKSITKTAGLLTPWLENEVEPDSDISLIAKYEYYNPFIGMNSLYSFNIPETAHVATIKPTSLWDALGYGSGMCFLGNVIGNERTFESIEPLGGLPFVAYWDIIRNYKANPQFPTIPVYGIGDSSSNDYNIRSPFVDSSVTLDQLDAFFANLYKCQELQSVDNSGPGPDVLSVWNYTLINGEFKASTSSPMNLGVTYYGCSAQGLYHPMSGLALSPYSPDYLTTVLDPQKVSNVVSKARVTTSAESGNQVFTIDQLRFANKRSRLLNISLFSGTRFDDWQRATWSIKPDARLGIPYFIGSCKSTIAFDEVLSNSYTPNPKSTTKGSGLGAAAGRVDDGFSSANHYFECDTYGLFMVLMTIRPKLFYAGRRPLTTRTNLSDIYMNIYDRVGYQDVFVSEYDSAQQISISSYPTKVEYTSVEPSGITYPSFKSAVGSVPAYSEYMTSVDVVSGELSPHGGTLDNWTTSFHGINYHTDLNADPITSANQLYTSLSEVTLSQINAAGGGLDSSFQFDSYGFPDEINNLFVDTRDIAQNFIVSIRHNLFVNRNKQKNILPTL